MSAFLSDKTFKSSANVIHLYIVVVSYIIYLFRKKSPALNLSLATYTFYKDYFTTLLKSNITISGLNNNVNLDSSYIGNTVYVTEKDLRVARNFINDNNLYEIGTVILFNLTVTTKFSMVPLDLQLKIIENVILSDDVSAVLIYKGNSDFDIEGMVLEKIPEDYKSKLVTIPNTFSINEFTCIIDFCDMFFSGDTGTVHIAASRKINVDSNIPLRNTTAVVSVFGASDSNTYSYDSERYGHSAAYQNAPSKVFVGAAPCRNITCINRLVKTCKEVRCFQGLTAEEMSSYIISYSGNLKNKVSVLEKVKV